MNPKSILSYSILAAGLIFVGGLCAQTQPKVDFPPPSPTCTLKQRVGLTDIEIVYSRPGVKDRKVFDGIVPYGQVWRTGANASTKVSFSTDVKLNGKQVPAGKYALYTIPGEEDWTIILQTNLTAGALNYNQKDDFVRLQTKSVNLGAHVETFTMDFTDVRDDSATLYLIWDQTYVPISMELDVTGKVLAQIDAAMKSEGKKQAGFYYQAANFYFNHDQDLKKALGWLNTGLEDKPRISYELLYLKAKILAKQGDKEGATAAAKESKDSAIKAEGPNSSFVKMNEDLISGLH
ncbi:MAG TPA: DUF2911 domain-containing protein [Candidatus Binatia bacterium]|jgi:hypothetical protein|nr:DUF2911 domain-containing protein [Candidatus Binatia bacterium]